MWEPTVSFSVEANIMETSFDEEYLYPFTLKSYKSKSSKKLHAIFTFLLITF